MSSAPSALSKESRSSAQAGRASTDGWTESRLHSMKKGSTPPSGYGRLFVSSNWIDSSGFGPLFVQWRYRTS